MVHVYIHSKPRKNKKNPLSWEEPPLKWGYTLGGRWEMWGRKGNISLINGCTESNLKLGNVTRLPPTNRAIFCMKMLQIALHGKCMTSIFVGIRLWWLIAVKLV